MPSERGRAGSLVSKKKIHARAQIKVKQIREEWEVNLGENLLVVVELERALLMRGGGSSHAFDTFNFLADYDCLACV